MEQPLGVTTTAPADNSPWGTGSNQVWVPGRGWQKLTRELVDSTPCHSHFSQLWRLDDEASRRLSFRCFDPACAVDQYGLGEPRIDPHFLCGYCGEIATLATLHPADGGKSAACDEHSGRLDDAYMADAAAREAQFAAAQPRRRDRRRR